MGSLRNPIGPLPSSIYWRRRAVLLSIVVLLVLLIAWAVNSLGGDGTDRTADQAKGDQDNGPVSSITPGPTDTGSAIGERPGGREEVPDDNPADGTDSGSPEDSSGAKDGDLAGGGTAESGADAGGGGGGGAGVAVAASLRACQAGDISLALRSVKNEYEPGAKPKLELVVKNSSGSDCRVDVGASHAVITITNSSDTEVWASDHCPSQSGGAAVVAVPAEGETTHTVSWDRKRSAPGCATPSGAGVKPGTYLVEAKISGVPAARTSFVLAKS